MKKFYRWLFIISILIFLGFILYPLLSSFIPLPALSENTSIAYLALIIPTIGIVVSAVGSKKQSGNPQNDSNININVSNKQGKNSSNKQKVTVKKNRSKNKK